MPFYGHTSSNRKRACVWFIHRWRECNCEKCMKKIWQTIVWCLQKVKQWFYLVSNPKESLYIERLQTLANLYCLKIYRENISLISIVNYLCLQLPSKSIKTTLWWYTKDYEKLSPFHDIHPIINVELWCGQFI